MGKMRVYELARDMGISSKRLVQYLESLGADVKNHMSTVEDELVQRVLGEFERAKAAHLAKLAAKAEGAVKTAPVEGTTPKPGPRPERAPQRNDRPGPANRPADRPAERQGERSGTGSTEGKPDAKKKGKPGGPTNRKGQQQPKAMRGQTTTRKPERRREARDTKEVMQTEIVLTGELTVGDLAEKLRIGVTALIKTLMGMGLMLGVNQAIDVETATRVCAELGVEVSRPEDHAGASVVKKADSPENLVTRPPVVTIMGHVDHGKTTLLDSIREARVVATEAGGITQHIGAYQVELKGKRITFLDTPGHEAFTSMRARGAQVTDVAILVVAADDGVMPQTVEAINHAKAAEVPIVVAINKMDKPGANPDRVRQELTEYGLVAEEWGGETITVGVSALKKQGIDDLLEMILLVAEMEELSANPNCPAEGTVVEGQLDKGRGPVATVLVQRGTLRVGDALVAGSVAGRVRAMMDDKGRRVEEAGPSSPVEVLGFDDVPRAGDLFQVMDDKDARGLASSRFTEQREKDLSQRRVSLEALYSQIQEGQTKELNIMIKADVQGSVEAMVSALERLSNEDVRIRVIHSGVGSITETDVMLASASNAIVIGFNVRPDTMAKKVSEREGVDIRTYRVIYEAINEIEQAMTGMLDPEFKEVVLGHAQVRAVFKVPKVGQIAGCYVQEGKITRSAKVRLLRDNVVIHEGQIDSLRRFKDDAREVAQGYECGIGIEKFNDIKEGDVIEAFTMQEVKRG